MRRLAAFALLLFMGACAHAVPGTPAAAGVSFAVYFQEWSAGLDAAGRKAVAQAAEQARRNPGVPIVVTGFAANDTGSNAANQLLSRTRAQVVIDQLREDGADSHRIRLAANGATAYQLDPVEARRVTISVGGT